MPSNQDPGDSDTVEVATCVVKRFRKYHATSAPSEDDSGTASHSSWQLLPTTSKAAPSLAPPRVGQLTPRTTEPPIAVHRSSPKNLGKVVPKMPLLFRGPALHTSSLQPPVFVRPPVGGLSTPQPKATPRSLLFQRFSAPHVSLDPWTLKDLFTTQPAEETSSKELRLPKGSQKILLTTSQLRDQQRINASRNASSE